MNPKVRRAVSVPYPVEYMVWPGGAGPATPVIEWILGHGGTARYHEDDDAHLEHLQIDAPRGILRANPGDVIVRGRLGTFEVWHAAIFIGAFKEQS